MADEMLAAVERELSGTYIMPSFGRYEQCAGLVTRIRARHPGPEVGVMPEVALAALAPAGAEPVA